jgi:putative transposase
MDNIFVERLWRSLKYEEVYLNAYASVAEAKAGIGSWLGFYNEERQHQSLGYRTPRQAYEAECRWGCGRKGRYMDNIFVERLWRSLKYNIASLLSHF